MSRRSPNGTRSRQSASERHTLDSAARAAKRPALGVLARRESASADSRLARKTGRRPTLPGAFAPSTIGANGLNFSVRNGKRCIPAAMTAQIVEEPAAARSGARAPSKLHSDDTSSKSRPRAISTGPLNALLRLHVPPINVVVFHGPYSLEGDGEPHLEVGFPLRCFQRLSRPGVANQQCRWHDN